MVDAVSVGASAIVSLLVALGTTEYRLRRAQSVEESAEIENWYIEAAQLASRLQKTWRQKFEKPMQENTFSGYDEVQSKMNLMAGQLNSHASEAQGKDVDEAVVNALDETANACEKVYQIHIHLNSQPEFREKGNQAVEKAEKLEELALANVSE